jgi:acyl-CoA synthetase (AMP-forming)/AMP-acid ligase II
MTDARTYAAYLEEVARFEQTSRPRTIPELFARAAESYGDRPVWMSIDGDECYNFARFSAEVWKCAAGLTAVGLTRGDVLGLMLPNVPAFMIAWLAAAHIGVRVVPINVHYKSNELRQLATESGMVCAIADAGCLPTSEALLGEHLFPERLFIHGGDAGLRRSWLELLDLGSGASLMRPKAKPEDILSIQFTSGSTGRPKGCLLSQEYWCIIGHVRAWQGPRVDSLLIDMPFHYMGGQWRFLMALVLGATAYVALRPTVRGMVRRLSEHRIEFCSVSPLLAKEPDPLSRELALKWAGTMALPGEFHAELEARLNGTPVREMYGLTETGAVLAMPVTETSMIGTGSLGWPVPYRECRIVDPDGHDVASGDVGELFVRGLGMMSGYHNNPEANEAAFEDGWLRTGDLFRKDENGFFAFVGRIKDVIRRSGENISASEVESTVLLINAVSEAAAIAVPDARRGEEVKIVLVLRSGLSHDDLPPSWIEGFCRERLADFKVPRYIEYAHSLPKTASGKIAKHELKVVGRTGDAVFDLVASDRRLAMASNEVIEVLDHESLGCRTYEE